ncbi:MAG: hypothetical protein AUI61_04325 [Thaumarchaeota archaeon 13_1_40CM_2_39_13_2]|nr:MAG: hypothetical protein AUI61_04325 [Thaumarchaeota archaeon 13_1_40CM_2_39_13_2]OLE41081.1 MAG: hypothetical protein AUG16_01320 [Thaumarchaeota archaeon 13_1_20CM_2_39_20]
MIGKDSYANLKAFIIIGSSVASFSSFVYHLFGYTIPAIMWVHLKEIGAALIMLAVFAFAVAWLLRAKPHKRPMRYFIKVYDVFGQESTIDGMRTEFKTYDVTLSFMEQYKKTYPLYNFALVSDLPNSDKLTIFRYL